MNIKRYRLYPSIRGLLENQDGPWVKWSDVERLLALRAAEAAELEAWRIATEEIKKQRAYEIENKLVAGGCVSSSLEQACSRLLQSREATNAARRAAGVEQ